MKPRCILLAGGVLAAVAAYVAFSVVLDRNRSRVGPPFANWTDDAGVGRFSIRVTAFDESGAGMVPGAYYKFESAQGAGPDWREVMTFRHDGPVPIPRDQVRRAGESVAYLFMGWMYAVTTDGGDSWTVWDAARDLPGWRCCNYGLIQDVALNADGTGTMTCKVIDAGRGEIPTLVTTDFGRTWERP